MIGGKILDISHSANGVNLRIMGTGTELHDDEVVWVVEFANRFPSVGDLIWRQGGNAYWTPAANVHHPTIWGQGELWDIPLVYIGSCDPHDPRARGVA